MSGGAGEKENQSGELGSDGENGVEEAGPATPLQSMQLRLEETQAGRAHSAQLADSAAKSPDDSVIIEDTPERKETSIIDISDSFSQSKEDLEELASPMGRKSSDSLRVNISPESEILAPNSLLYENCENINKVIDDDEDVQSMLASQAGDMDILEIIPHAEYSFFSPKKTKKDAWSPKKEIWSAKTQNEKKRKASTASLSSSDESSKKKLDQKDPPLEGKADVDKSCDADDELGMSGGSRPASSQAVASHNISCSPITPAAGQGELQVVETQQGSQRPANSTPLHNKRKTVASTALSSPQQQLRDKQKQGCRQTEEETAQPPGEPADSFIKPSTASRASPRLLFSVADMPGASLTLAFTSDPPPERLEALLAGLAGLGCRQEAGQEPAARPAKRLSEVTNSSYGGSSGYLGGSSSGAGSGSSTGSRSRLSLAPESHIRPHSIIAPLPSPAQHKHVSVAVPDDENVQHIASQLDTNVPREPKVKGKRGRKKKVIEGDPKDTETESNEEETNKKRVTKKKTSQSNKNELKEENLCFGSEVNNYNDRYAVNTKVFARWVDSTGVCFYPAVIKETVDEEEVTVMFLEDRIERPLKKETEVITVSQLRTGDLLTVKHSLYKLYPVTARLLSNPRKRDDDFDYEVEIAATESEPQNNEDSRVVTHAEVSLTDRQASDILRALGLVPDSNKVRTEITLENLIFRPRKSRPASQPGTPSSSTAGTTPRRRRGAGGENIEESATTAESSAADFSPKKKKGPKTPKTPKTVPTPRRQKRIFESTDEECEEILPKSTRRLLAEEVEKEKLLSIAKVDQVPKGPRRSSKAKEIFSGLTFVLTQSRERVPLTESEEEEEEEEGGPGQLVGQKFDMKALREAILAQGGMVRKELAGGGPDLSEHQLSLVCISDRCCVTRY